MMMYVEINIKQEITEAASSLIEKLQGEQQACLFFWRRA